MEPQFKATLTSTEGPVEGIIKHITHGAFKKAYQFDAMDDTLHLVIAPDEHGNWQKIAGTEPYLFGWVDEMAEQITKLLLNGLHISCKLLSIILLRFFAITHTDKNIAIQKSHLSWLFCIIHDRRNYI